MATDADNKGDIERLRQYILKCPTVPSDGIAVRAALQGLDTEFRRIERDEKLRKKFSVGSEEKKDASQQTSVEDEWEDVHRYQDESSKSTGNFTRNANVLASSAVESGVVVSPTATTHDSALGRSLASASISAMSEAGTRVSSPEGALALAIHAALRSDMLGFKCTGIPDDDDVDLDDDDATPPPQSKKKKKSASGFAAPIRELPKGVFVPSGWDRTSKIRIRYRKDGVGSTILRVAGKSESVTIRFIPTSTTLEPGGPGGRVLQFDLHEHVNLESLTAAVAKSGAVQPALHYKALSGLMSKFASTFDLGSIKDDAACAVDDDATMTIVEETGKSNQEAALRVSQPLGEAPPTDRLPLDVGLKDGIPTPRIDTEVPGIRARPVGDFADDLAPGGVRLEIPNVNRGGDFGLDGGAGNLMGPNHPAFRGGGLVDDAGFAPPSIGGGRHMGPRFDPIYPAGIGPPNHHDDPLRDPRFRVPGRGGRGGPGRGGLPGRGVGFGPNNDHLRPPSNLGGGFI